MTFSKVKLIRCCKRALVKIRLTIPEISEVGSQNLMIVLLRFTLLLADHTAPSTLSIQFIIQILTLISIPNVIKIGCRIRREIVKQTNFVLHLCIFLSPITLVSVYWLYMYFLPLYILKTYKYLHLMLNLFKMIFMQ